MNVFSFEERQRFARESYFELLRRVSVMVLPRGDLREIGSGVLMATPTGRPCVLTARHVVEDVTGLKVRIAGELIGEIGDAVERVFLGPERPGWAGQFDDRHVDVALLGLRPAACVRIAESVGNSHRDVAVAETAQVLEKDQIVMTGFPSGLHKAPADGQPEIGSLRYMTSVQGRDSRGLLEVCWDSGEAIPGGVVPEHSEHRPGVAFDMVHPRGISGGGVWRVRGPSGPTEILSPTRHCQLIGISSAVVPSRRVELAEPVELWRKWLIDSASLVE